jgi:uncharacterized repeat protein (TIGR03803 family)
MPRKFSAISFCAKWLINFFFAAGLVAGAMAQYSVTTLANFSGSNGSGPYSPVILGSDGNLYGTTIVGGSKGFGTVYKLTPQGALQTIYNFCSKANCADGSSPWAGLTEGADGDFYGATVYGGANPNCEYAGGCGTLFKITTAGVLTTLYSFDGDSSGFPYASLLLAKDGNFYGTSTYTDKNDGTIFRMTPDGSVKVLYTFLCCASGSDPESPLVQDSAGILYGTTLGGGIQNGGTAFRITTSGQLTILHKFCQQANCEDGSKPTAVILASDGNLYGTTYAGGNNFAGTVFRLSTAGAFKLLFKFSSSGASNPYAGLVQGKNGLFYGTTFVGGPSRDGTIFSITPAGTLTILHNFTNSDGALPQAPLIQSTDGSFYGTTSAGGSGNAGVVFKLSKN